MNQRMSGDIQNVQGIPAVDRAVEMIKRKSDQLDPREFQATWTASSAKPSAEEVNQVIEELMQKQKIPMGTQPGTAVYPYA